MRKMFDRDIKIFNDIKDKQSKREYISKSELDSKLKDYGVQERRLKEYVADGYLKKEYSDGELYYKLTEKGEELCK